MSQGSKLVCFDNTKCAVMGIENCCVSVFKLAVLNKLSKGLRKCLKIYQKLLVLFQYVKILFIANKLV